LPKAFSVSLFTRKAYEQLRDGIVAKTPPTILRGEAEIDEVYVVSGHKGQPAKVEKGGGSVGGAG